MFDVTSPLNRDGTTHMNSGQSFTPCRGQSHHTRAVPYSHPSYEVARIAYKAEPEKTHRLLEAAGLRAWAVDLKIEHELGRL